MTARINLNWGVRWQEEELENLRKEKLQLKCSLFCSETFPVFAHIYPFPHNFNFLQPLLYMMEPLFYYHHDII